MPMRTPASFVVCWLLSGICAAARAENATVEFTIGPQTLASALIEFSKQAKVQVLTPSSDVKDIETRGVRGRMGIEKALRRLLQGTGFSFQLVGGDTVALKRIAAGRPAVLRQSSVDVPGKDSADEKGDDKEVEVLVQSKRLKPFSDRNVDLPRTRDDVQPYYIFDSKVIEQSAAFNVEAFLQQRLTMNTIVKTNTQAIGVSGSSTTTSTVDLRGLGANQTLILVNGRRMAGVALFSADGAPGQPDLNGLPLAAIDRIEILPSSASAIYGGSAVGGVVNIILKKNYSGGDIAATYDSTWDGLAPVRTLSGTYGFGFEGGKSHLMLTAQYSDSRPMLVGDRVNLINRGYSRILENFPGFLGYDPTLQTIQAPRPGATPNLLGLDPATFAVTDLTLKGSNISLNSPIATLPEGYSSSSDPATIIGGRWNLALPDANAAPNGLRTPLGSNPKNQSVTAQFSRQMTDKVELFVDSIYTSNKSFQEQGANEGVQIIDPALPNNPFNQFVVIVFPDAATAPFTTNSISYTATVGFKADLPHAWNSEMDYTWSRSKAEGTLRQIDSTAVNNDIANGTLNPFVDTIAHPLDTQSYFYSVPFDFSSTVNDIALRAAGPVGKFPWGSPRLNFSLELRKESTPENILEDHYAHRPDADDIFDYLAQSQSIKSFYVEGDIPLITDANALPLLRSFELQLADHVDWYSVDAGSRLIVTVPNGNPPYYYITPTPPDSLDGFTGGTVQHAKASYSSNNQTFGVKYKPVQDVTLRASVGTAFLPPTQQQLFPNTRPCSQCDQIHDPVLMTDYSVDTIGGGNPNLKPQHSKSWNFGLIYEPGQDFLRGLRFDLEFYQIAQSDYITGILGNQILTDPSLASRVTRAPGPGGLITQIDESLINATEYKTAGYDLSLDYHRPTHLGTFDLHAAGTRINYDRRQTSLGNPAVDYAGIPLGEGAAVRLKGNASLNWAYRNWGLGWSVIWYGSYPQYGSAADPITNTTSYTDAQGSDRIPSQIYHDFFASYAFGKTQAITDGLSIQFGVKNIFNMSPRFDAYYSPFFVSQLGDLRLRDFWLTVRKAF